MSERVCGAFNDDKTCVNVLRGELKSMTVIIVSDLSCFDD